MFDPELREEDFEYLGWLEWRDWGEFEPGDSVVYTGTIERCHGQWVVVEMIAVDYYKLRHPSQQFATLNASRIELTPLHLDAM